MFSQFRSVELSVELVGGLLCGGYLRAVICDCLVLSLGRQITIYCLDSSPQFSRVCLMIQRLHFCLLCSFVILVISSFISCRAGEVESLDLRSSRALIFSNMCCDAALRMAVDRKPSFAQLV